MDMGVWMGVVDVNVKVRIYMRRYVLDNLMLT